MADPSYILTARQEIRRARRSASGWKKDAGTVRVNAGSSNTTFHDTFSVERPYHGVQVTMFNADPAAQITGATAAFAPSANIATNFYTPSAGLSALTQFTFPSTVIPVAQGLAGSAYQDVILGSLTSYTKWVESVPRDDGGPGYLAMLRTYCAAGTGVSGNVGVQYTDMEFQTGNSAGDKITNGGGGVFSFSQASSLAAVKFLFNEPVTSVMTIGDSTVAGTYADTSSAVTGAQAAVRVACRALSAAGAAVHFINGANSSSVATNAVANATVEPNPLYGYLARFLGYLASGLIPEVAVLQPWSVNNLNKYKTVGLAETNFVIAKFLEACRTYDIVPILMTPCPANGLIASDETGRRAVVALIKSHTQYGWPLLIDRDAYYTDYTSSTGGFKTGMSGDGIHPTRAWHIAEGTAIAVPVLAKVL